MSNINLLPWREERRARKDKQLLFSSFMFWAGCLLVGFLALQYLDGKLADQRERNSYLQRENAKLNQKISEIEKLRAEKQELIGRIDVIQGLQQDRMQIVHVLDDVVRVLPAGVTLDRLSKRSKVISLAGRAQSNSRVSELMNQADTSRWFGQSNLSVVSLKETEDSTVSEFELVINEKIPLPEDPSDKQQDASRVN